MKSAKKITALLIFCLLIPAVVVGGTLLFRGRRYVWITLCVTVLSILPFFLRFERREQSARRIILIGALTALSVVGRILFAPVPGFKPVTAMTVIAALHFGPEAGFLTGALSALISNFYFGQGPWTPFQMLGWGLIGLIAGLLAKPLRRSKILLAVFGALSGVFYSLILDVWTVLWADGFFNPARYLAAILSAGGFVLIYALSNVVFLLLLEKPIGKILERIKVKYGI